MKKSKESKSLRPAQKRLDHVKAVKANWITKRIKLHEDYKDEVDYEDYLDTVAEKVGEPCLEDIHIKKIKRQGNGMLVLEVTGIIPEEESY